MINQFHDTVKVRRVDYNGKPYETYTTREDAVEYGYTIIGGAPVNNQNDQYMQLQTATRNQVKMRLNLSGPSGSGKTMSALKLARGLADRWEDIAVVDTENSSASLYSHLGAFKVLDLVPPFSPERYIQAIDLCVKAGVKVIILDSSTHEWSGVGGCLESNDTLAKVSYKGNTWSAWNETTPRHDAFVNKVLQCPVHIITCTRSKMETVMTDDKKVKKLGMKDIQREGWEYELTVSLNIDRDTHMATPSKDRTNLFEGKQPFVITEATGEAILKWCNEGTVKGTLTPATAVPPVTASTETPKPFKLTAKTRKEIEGLISGSTLDANGQFTAKNSLENAKNDADITKIKTRLLQLQATPS